MHWNGEKSLKNNLVSFDELKRLKQPCGQSCYSTCVAMAMGKTANEVIEELKFLGFGGPPYFNYQIITYLVKNGIYADKISAVFKVPLMIGQHHLVSVCSKNRMMKKHCILISVSDFGDLKLIDPNEGRPNKNYYTLDDWLGGKVPFGDIMALHDCH